MDNPILFIYMQSTCYQCGVCDEWADDSFALPYWNGEPCSVNHDDVDGYRMVCIKCYEEYKDI